MKAKKGSYETAVLKTIAKLGPSTPYMIAKEILTNDETRELVRKEYKNSKDILKIYSVVFKAIKRLVKKEYLIAIKDKEKRYGLSFKGLIYLQPDYEEIKNIIEKNRESLFNYQNVQVNKEVINKNRIEYQIDYADNELEFLLQVLTKANEADYKTLIEVISEIIDWKETNGENIINCLYAILKDFELSELIIRNAVNAVNNNTAMIVFERFENYLINKCLKHLETARTCLSIIKEAINDIDTKKKIEKDIEKIKEAILKLL
jgi:hypothetical protein